MGGTSLAKWWCIMALLSLRTFATRLRAYMGPNYRGRLLAGHSYYAMALNSGMLNVCGTVLAVMCAVVTLSLFLCRRIVGGGRGGSRGVPLMLDGAHCRLSPPCCQ